MLSEGFLATSQSGRISYLREGNEGIFAGSDFSRVAGNLFVDRTETCYYLPNFYTDNIEFRQLYETFNNDVQKTDLQRLIKEPNIDDGLDWARTDRAPICVVATGTGSIEQFLAAHEVTNDHNLWFHVDAAYGGTLVFSDTE